MKWHLQAKNGLQSRDTTLGIIGGRQSSRLTLFGGNFFQSLPCYIPTHRHLNLIALTRAQLEAAALEAGAPLADLLPSGHETSENGTGNVDTQPQPRLTHTRIGGMVSLLGQFAVAFAHNHVDTDTKTSQIRRFRRRKAIRENLVTRTHAGRRIVSGDGKS